MWHFRHQPVARCLTLRRSEVRLARLLRQKVMQQVSLYDSNVQISGHDISIIIADVSGHAGGKLECAAVGIEPMRLAVRCINEAV